MNDTEFKEVDGSITLHGLGFIQLKLPNNSRLHVWHPKLPRRKNAEISSVHNHRFSFQSTVLVGTQVNRRYAMVEYPKGDYDIISHDGPRRPNGSRESYVAGRANIIPYPDGVYQPGESYVMHKYDYHETPNEGMVVTLMKKLEEDTVHAKSLILHGQKFDQEFDRFMFSEDELWAFVREALSL